jgi:tetratricopeptide (TPR) repeat protein
MGKLDEAAVKFREAFEINAEFIWSPIKLAYIHALLEEYDTAIKLINQIIESSQTPSMQATGYAWKGFYYYWLGSYQKSLVELKRAQELWEEVEYKRAIGFIDWMRAWISFEKAEHDEMQKYLKNWLNTFTAYYPKRTERYISNYNYWLAFSDLEQSRVDSAAKRLNEINQLIPAVTDRSINELQYQHKLLQIELNLAKKFFDEAIEECSILEEIDLPSRFPWDWIIYNVPFYHDHLARAYYQKGELDKALDEYKKLINFTPVGKARYLVNPRYHYRLAKISEEKGLFEDAIQQYQKFLEIWKDADESLPDLLDAQLRFERLKQIQDE